MAYNGSTFVASGLKQFNNNTYPLVHANDVQVGDNESTRLSDILSGLSGGAVPSGGTTGQALIKASNTDYDVEWGTISGGGSVSHDLPSGGSQGQILVKSSSTDYDAAWVNAPDIHSIPSGGTDGQVLIKSSATNYDVEWGAVSGLPTVSTSDNGKVLRVVSGAWAVVSLPSASGVSF